MYLFEGDKRQVAPVATARAHTRYRKASAVPRKSLPRADYRTLSRTYATRLNVENGLTFSGSSGSDHSVTYARYKVQNLKLEVFAKLFFEFAS